MNYIATAKQMQEAEIIARKRKDQHIKKGQGRDIDPRKDKYENEYYGVLAEILFMEWLDLNHIKYDAAPLYTEDTRLSSREDININGLTIDLKSIPPDDYFKRRQAQIPTKNYKNCNFYVFFKFVSKSEYYFAGAESGENVKVWNIAGGKYGAPDYFWNWLNNLPIQEIADLKAEIIQRILHNEK